MEFTRLLDRINNKILGFMMRDKMFGDYYYTISVEDSTEYVELYGLWKQVFFTPPPKTLGVVANVEMPFSQSAEARYYHLLNSMTIMGTRSYSDGLIYKAGRYKGLNMLFIYDGEGNRLVMFDPVDRFSIFTL